MLVFCCYEMVFLEVALYRISLAFLVTDSSISM